MPRNLSSDSKRTFLESRLAGKSLRKCAQDAGICFQTAWELSQEIEQGRFDRLLQGIGPLGKLKLLRLSLEREIDSALANGERPKGVTVQQYLRMTSMINRMEKNSGQGEDEFTQLLTNLEAKK